MTTAEKTLFERPQITIKSIVVTICVILALRFAAYIPVAGANIDFAADNGLTSGGIERMSIVALGALPWVSAAIIFELFRALLPFVRRFSIFSSGYVNPYNSWVLVGAFALGIIQSSGIVAALSGMGFVVGELAFAAAMASLLGGVALVVFAAWLIDRFGTGFGFWLVFGYQSITALLSDFGSSFSLMRSGAVSAEAAAIQGILIVMVVVGLVYLFVSVFRRQDDAIEMIVWPVLVAAMLVSLVLPTAERIVTGYWLNDFNWQGRFVIIQAIILVTTLLFLWAYVKKLADRKLLLTSLAVISLALGAPIVAELISRQPQSLIYSLSSGQMIAMIGYFCWLAMMLQGRRKVRGNP